MMPAQLNSTLGVIPPAHDALVKYAPLLGFLLPLAAWGQETPTPRRLGLDSLHLVRLIATLPQMRDTLADPPLGRAVEASARELRVHLAPLHATRGVSFILRRRANGGWTATRLRVATDASIARSVRADSAALATFWREDVAPVLAALPRAAYDAWAARSPQDDDARALVLIEVVDGGAYAPWSFPSPSPATAWPQPIGRLLRALPTLWRSP